MYIINTNCMYSHQ